MVEVMVIGVEPPCPRCDLVHLWAEEIADEYEGKVVVKNLCYTDLNAQNYSRLHGKKLGSAHEVSNETGVKIDNEALKVWMTDRVLSIGEFERQAELWTPEMDEIIEPCRNAADSYNWLMTPVIVINNEIKHHGSVPCKKEFREWIKPKN